MDAVEYLKTMKRMCNECGKCERCPLNKAYSCVYEENPEEAVAIVEQWLKEHPKMTNADKLIKVFGRIRLSDITPDWLRQEYREPKGKV